MNEKWKIYAREMLDWLILLLRFCIGLAIMHTGWKLMRGDMYYGISLSDDPITPIFLLLVGAYCAFSGLLAKLADGFSQK